MPANSRFLGAAALLLSTTVVPVAAQDKPFWELGVGAAAISFSDYIGSDNRQGLLLPVPYVVYRSERLEVDRDSVVGNLFRSENLRLQLSLSGSIPVDSEDNDDRRGMPDLDPTVEIGPSLQYTLYRHPNSNGRLIVELPVRSVIAVDTRKIDPVGWVSNPNIRYHREFQTNSGRWSTDVSLGPLYGSRRYHDYLYGVAPRFANADRPAFETDGGFGGWRLSMGFSRRLGDFWYGGFVRYIDLSGADFGDSPLVKQDYSILGGVGVAWIFAKSGASVR